MKTTKPPKANMQVVKDDTTIRIISADIKDDYCHYSYEVITGIGSGDTHTVKGSTNIIDDDMRTAFSKLNPHIACIDDIFKHANVEVKNIDSMGNDDLTLLYEVTGFKIKGAEENESVILKGTKYVSAGGRMELDKTPQIPIDNTSSYKWYNELKAAVTKCREEVELYRGGKYTVAEEDEEKVVAAENQLGLYNKKEGDGVEDDDFKKAKK